MLFAIEHTPLYARLEREGRLLDYDLSTVQVHGSADLNFVPKQMTAEELLRGYRWMIRALYRYDHYGGAAGAGAGGSSARSAGGRARLREAASGQRNCG